MTRRLWRWLPWLLGAALLVVVIRLVWVNEVVAALRQLRPGEITIRIAANSVVLPAITARWALLRGLVMIHFLGLDLTLPQLVTTLTAARLAILLLLPAGLGALELSQVIARFRRGTP